MSDTHMPLLKNLEYEVTTPPRDRLPKTISARTRRVYDILSSVYPISTFLFHSNAHRAALDMSGIRDGMKVLEVATGSGEMFRRLVNANPRGRTVGFDLSPRMAERTLRMARREFPRARVACQAVDARFLPFRDSSFDAVVCCYLLELLAADDIVLALAEFRRVLRANGRLTLVCIGQNAEFFNQIYRVIGTLAPAFWGRQVEERISSMLEVADFRVVAEHKVRQSLYPSRVLAAEK
jgi:ubiquinone/menaquinone biosynthesis C-methylase UbiE